MLIGVAFVIDYFNYIEVPHFLNEIKMSQPSDKLVLDSFGKLTERTLGKNLKIGDMAKKQQTAHLPTCLGTSSQK